MKKFLLTLLILNFSVINCFSYVNWKNDSKEMFRNNKLIIMEINPRTFGAKDLNDNGIIEPEASESSGNFVNAKERLKELKGMGINAIHILPVTPTGKLKALGTAGSLYALNDFTSINPMLDAPNNGMEVFEEFERFVEECHKNNIRVIVDLPSCGAYDLFLKNPDLFYIGENGAPVSPADWLDVNLFRTKNSDGTLNEKLLELHKDFIQMLIRAKVDGIRADVASLKPYDFWKQIILYARARDPQFLFLAEASNSWTEAACKECEFTSYDKLLEVGFDGYYGSYFGYKDWKTVSDLEKQVIFDMDLSKKYPDKKSAIGSFMTHDEQSPILIGGYNYAEQIIWLSSLLPLNPYYVDGIQSGDNYIYPYANQKAKKTYTDNETYYVHKGKIDIFNFSRRPGGEFPQLKKEISMASKFRNYSQDIIIKGKFITLKADNTEVFAFARTYDKKTIFVILNKNKLTPQKAEVNYKKFFKKDNYIIIKSHSKPVINKNKIEVTLEPSEIMVLYSDNKL